MLMQLISGGHLFKRISKKKQHLYQLGYTTSVNIRKGSFYDKLTINEQQRKGKESILDHVRFGCPGVQSLRTLIATHTEKHLCRFTYVVSFGILLNRMT